MSSAHEQSVSEFLRFARFKRGQCVKTVETAFQHLADSRLVEDTFTCERGEGWEGGREGKCVRTVDTFTGKGRRYRQPWLTADW